MKNNNITPVMKQFLEAKTNHPDSIMLFRMGDFYETFDEDAISSSFNLFFVDLNCSSVFVPNYIIIGTLKCIQFI